MNKTTTTKQDATTQNLQTEVDVDKLVEGKGDDRQSAFFYSNADAGQTAIAEAEDQHGNVYQLVSTGQIRVKVDGELYRTEGIEELIKEKELTDKDLQSDRVEFLNNNWFEIMWKQKSGNRWNSEIGVVRFNYDSAIEMLKLYAETCYAEPENQKEVNC